ncbi:dihydrofolate reductase [Paracoccus pacificus]|uniref:Dihydrofolate reductase n=1 Tax=Paracoccus pacificus TaxID=1463598 RepID=A0ABW4RD41_9RHOB
MLTLIVARGRDGAIGKAGGIPWHISEDLRMFKRETLGGAVIMGRRTWESLPVRPLKDRLNCVLSRDPGVAENVFSELDTAIGFCRAEGYHRIYGLGGEAVFRDLLPRADRLMITEVDTTVPGADTFFPAFDEGDWWEINRQPLSSEAPAAVLRELLRR